MNTSPASKRQTYVENAPPPTDPLIFPSIYYIELQLDQAVEWVWTDLPDGNRVVTDYQIISKSERAKD